ncbi:MAG TPA: hypothetical protein VFG27_09245 [Pseudomonadales bacterium]|nr:hypothetical protein [Pseudomonadales bacterium]
MRGRPAALLAAGVLAAGCAAGSGAPPAPTMTAPLPDRDGAIEVLSGQQRLTGQLSLPDGPGPFPAMILMHGCNGVGRAERGWASALVSWGYAAFVVDSFTELAQLSAPISAPRMTGRAPPPARAWPLRCGPAARTWSSRCILGPIIASTAWAAR